MSNAWFHYYVVGPLGISIVFVIVGIACLCFCWWGPRDADGRRKFRPSGIPGGIFGLAVGGTMGLYFVLTSPTPRERERIFDHVFRTPPERIEQFIIKAGAADRALPLTLTEVVIDDPARIRQIAEILRRAREVGWSHPHARWYANIEMVTRDGTYYFFVEATVPDDPNGTLVSAGTTERGGWNLGEVRADGLDEILEDAVNKARKPD
ncbi:MAG: hypothetical protein ACJ8F7_23345 [Gemmataceae bacterium]